MRERGRLLTNNNGCCCKVETVFGYTPERESMNNYYQVGTRVVFEKSGYLRTGTIKAIDTKEVALGEEGFGSTIETILTVKSAEKQIFTIEPKEILCNLSDLMAIKRLLSPSAEKKELAIDKYQPAPKKKSFWRWSGER